MTKYKKIINNNEVLKKAALVSLSVALAAGLCGCAKTTESVLNDGVSISSEEINSIPDEDARAKNDLYYEEYDKYLDDMTEDEQKEFLVHVIVTTNCSEENKKDEIMFLRDDSTYVGSAKATGGEIYIPIGNYKLVSLIDEENKLFGEISVLSSGEEVELFVDVDNKTSDYTIVSGAKSK